MERTSWTDPSLGTATLVRIDDRDKWQRIISQFQDSNYRQGWAYGLESADRHNARIERMAVRSGTELVGAAMVRLKKIPFVKTGMAYVGAGPITRRGREDDLTSLRICLSALRREYMDLRGYTLRILPPLHPAGGYDAVTECFRSSGFDPSPWPPPFRTILVNINRPIEEIRKTLNQKWRNGLNNSEKRGIEIIRGNSLDLFQQFADIHDRFMDRKHISVDVGADFYRELRARNEGDEGYYICLAMVDGKPVSGQLVNLLGDTGVTILAATGDAGLKCKASNLLQWDAVVEARRRGLHWFDLGGIEPESQPGVYHFKCGLGGVETASPGPFQASPSGLLGSVTPTVERLYRWTRRYGLRA